MTQTPLLPKREDLRKAISWLSQQPKKDSKTIEAASVKFGLSPLDEEFLLNHFRQGKEKG